jgi:hypothetical protein
LRNKTWNREVRSNPKTVDFITLRQTFLKNGLNGPRYAPCEKHRGKTSIFLQPGTDLHFLLAKIKLASHREER